MRYIRLAHRFSDYSRLSIELPRAKPIRFAASVVGNGGQFRKASCIVSLGGRRHAENPREEFANVEHLVRKLTVLESVPLQFRFELFGVTRKQKSGFFISAPCKRAADAGLDGR